MGCSPIMTKPGQLNGLTVLRFAHAFESGGGTERYLDDLDRALLGRNAMTILRLYLTRNPSGAAATEESIGKGALVRIRLPILARDSAIVPTDEHPLRDRLMQKARDSLLYNPIVWRAGGARWVAARRSPREPGQAVGAGIAAAKVLGSRRVDLVMLHFFGGADADEVVLAAQEARVPFALLNHYSNDRFLHVAIRKHVMVANGVAGVNGLGLPRYVRNRFSNLSDGIDTEFFRRANARPLEKPEHHPVVLLPARVVPEKGQMDLVRAVASLRHSGLDCGIAFAGRVDSSCYVDKLRAEIARNGMVGCVRFLGDLNVEELRDWYAASEVVAFPTYHHEGLGRAIIEAQAMETPVVAYATGGVAEGIVAGKTGFLLPTGDIAGLSNRLRELLTSPAFRATMGANGREEAEQRFSLIALADRHEQFYTWVINVSRHSGAMAPF
jgi:glycosyltransferase involved in cell wall biosynthesis